MLRTRIATEDLENRGGCTLYALSGSFRAAPKSLKTHVSHLVVCDPRKNAILRDGNKSDRVDARKLAELLRTNQIKRGIEHSARSRRGAYLEYRDCCNATKRAQGVESRIAPQGRAVLPPNIEDAPAEHQCSHR
jgi:hypothetical protein